MNQESKVRSGLPEPRHGNAAQLLVLALPIIGMTVSRMLMGFVDFAMVSRLGTEAQAAISPATILVFAVLCVGMGAVSTVQTFAAQADGRGKPAQGSAYAWQSLYIALGFGLLIWPITRAVPAFYEWIGAFAGHDPEVQRLESIYTSMALWSFTPSVICVGLNGFFMGIRRPRIGLISIVISIGFNILGNYALIFGHFGFEPMGIRGAAIATVFAWWVRAAVLFAAFCSPVFHEKYRTRETMAFSRAKMAGIARIGIPASFQWLIDIGSWVAFMMIVVPVFGKEAMAATNIGLQYMHLSFMPAIGLGMALCSMVGFAIGEAKREKAEELTRLALKITMIYMGSIALILLVGRRSLVRIFTDDEAVIAAGARVLTWAAIFQLFDALFITYQKALQGAGDTRWPAIATGVCCWGIFIGGGYAMARLAPGFGLNGPWMMCTLYVVAVGLLMRWRFASGAWKKIELFAGEDDAPAPRPAPAAVASHPADPA